uniref:uncharacterized protein LOC120348427 n=1 Tax=Styela clava TaxID=7725 RepID=UPI0019397941|nr:uncharacterized protein LOC120348427 [Styela clava]
MNKLLIASVVLAAVFAKGLALNCYVCGACNTPTNEFTCNSGNTTGFVDKCVKTTTTTAGISVIGRSCIFTSSSLSTTANGCTSTTVSSISTEICYCDTDLCNGSRTVKFSIALTALIVGVVAKLLA